MALKTKKRRDLHFSGFTSFTGVILLEKDEKGVAISIFQWKPRGRLFTQYKTENGIFSQKGQPSKSSKN